MSEDVRRCAYCKHTQLFVIYAPCSGCWELDEHPNFEPNLAGKLAIRAIRIEEERDALADAMHYIMERGFTLTHTWSEKSSNQPMVTDPDHAPRHYETWARFAEALPQHAGVFRTWQHEAGGDGE